MDLNTEFNRLLDNTGWSQAKAAQELHTTTATISRYVNGKMKPRPQVIAHLARITHQVAKLPSGSDYSALNDAPRLEEWERTLIETLRRVPGDRRRKVIESIIATVQAHDPEPVTYGARKAKKTDTKQWADGAAEKIVDEIQKKIEGKDPPQ